MAAAVADYRPADARDGQAAEGRRAVAVELEPTHGRAPRARRRRRNGQVLVGFAADDGRRAASSARARSSTTKSANLIVFNDVSRDDIGFDAADNEVVLVTGTASGASGRHRRKRSQRPSSTRPGGCWRRGMDETAVERQEIAVERRRGARRSSAITENLGAGRARAGRDAPARACSAWSARGT